MHAVPAVGSLVCGSTLDIACKWLIMFLLATAQYTWVQQLVQTHVLLLQWHACVQA